MAWPVQPCAPPGGADAQSYRRGRYVRIPELLGLPVRRPIGSMTMKRPFLTALPLWNGRKHLRMSGQRFGLPTLRRWRSPVRKLKSSFTRYPSGQGPMSIRRFASPVGRVAYASRRGSFKDAWPILEPLLPLAENHAKSSCCHKFPYSMRDRARHGCRVRSRSGPGDHGA